MALRDGPLLGEPDHGELRVDEDGARDHPVIHGARRLVGKGVVGGDASVLAADRGGHLGVRLGTDHVTRGVDVRHVAAQELVHLHLGSPVQRDPGLLDFDEVRVRAPPGRDKQIRCFEFQAAAVGLDRGDNAGLAPAHCTHLGAGEDAHSLAFEDLAHGRADLGLVAMCKQLPAPLHQRHLRSEAREHLPKLQGDVSAADDEERARQLAQLLLLVAREQIAGEVRRVIEAVDLGQRGARAGGDEDAVAAQPPAIHLDGV